MNTRRMRHSDHRRARPRFARTALQACVAAALGTTAFAGVHAQELEEIIVTAQKREESLQEVPIAITAIDGGDLSAAGISQPTDLNALVPGLGIAQGGPSTQVYLRGVGNYATNSFADPAVAFYIDGVYVSRFSGISGNFFDVQRAEVLKGPQGTLYGRNATGGLINIVTNKPIYEVAAGVGVEIGNYELIRGEAYLNLPINDVLAVRLAGQTTDRDGYHADGYDDDQSTAGRLHVLYEPTEMTSALLTVSYLDIGGRGPVHVPLRNAGYVIPGDPWAGLAGTLPYVLPAPPPPGPGAALYGGLNRKDGNLDVEVFSVSAEVNHDFGAAALTVLGNYMNNDNDSRSYGPGFLFDTRHDAEQISIEARLAGSTEVLDWVGGVYYFDEEQSEMFWVDQGFLFNQTGSDMDDNSDTTFAAFGQLTYSLNEQARLTAGVRYTNEEKSVDGRIFSRQPQAFPCAANGLPTVFLNTIVNYIPQAATNGTGAAYPFPYCMDAVTGEREWDDWSWKFGAEYDVSDDSMLYASVSRGFKAGGFFAAGNSSIQGNSFEPERLIAFAVGSKNRFMDGRVQLNGEVFYWDYNDHQESYLAPTSAAGTFNFVTQRADGEIYGVDLELDWLITDYDELSFRFQYLHAEYNDAPFINASPGPGNPSPRSACTGTQDPAIPAIWYMDCDGQEMPRSPEFSGTAAYHHTFPLGNGGSVVAGGNLRFSDSYWAAVDYNPLQRADSYVTFGVDLSYIAPDERWSVTLWGRNLSDEVIFSNAFMYPGTNSVVGGGAGNISNTQLEAPLTFGLRFRADF